MPPPAPSKGAKIAGWILSLLPVPLMIFSASAKFIQPPGMEESLTHIGWAMDQVLLLGIIEVTCVAIYLIPRTAVLGAILLTGYMGGAMATHLRVHEPPIMQFVLGVVFWLGLFLREPRLRALIPLRKG